MSSKQVLFHIPRPLENAIRILAEKRTFTIGMMVEELIELAYISHEVDVVSEGKGVSLNVRLGSNTLGILKKLGERDKKTYGDLLLRGLRLFLVHTQRDPLTLRPIPCFQAYAFPRLKASGKRYTLMNKFMLNDRDILSGKARFISFPNEILIVGPDRDWCAMFNKLYDYPLCEASKIYNVRRVYAVTRQYLPEFSHHVDVEMMLFLRDLFPTANIDAKAEIRAARATLTNLGGYLSSDAKNTIRGALTEEFSEYISDVVFE